MLVDLLQWISIAPDFYSLERWLAHQLSSWMVTLVMTLNCIMRRMDQTPPKEPDLWLFAEINDMLSQFLGR